MTCARQCGGCLSQWCGDGRAVIFRTFDARRLGRTDVARQHFRAKMLAQRDAAMHAANLCLAIHAGLGRCASSRGRAHDGASCGRATSHTLSRGPWRRERAGWLCYESCCRNACNARTRACAVLPWRWGCISRISNAGTVRPSWSSPCSAGKPDLLDSSAAPFLSSQDPVGDHRFHSCSCLVEISCRSTTPGRQTHTNTHKHTHTHTDTTHHTAHTMRAEDERSAFVGSLFVVRWAQLAVAPPTARPTGHAHAYATAQRAWLIIRSAAHAVPARRRWDQQGDV